MKTKEQAAQEYAKQECGYNIDCKSEDNCNGCQWFDNNITETQMRHSSRGFLAGVKFANRWENGDTPPKKEDYPKHNDLQCLIVRKDRGFVEMAYYDFHYKSWNDSDNDDHLCDTEQVEKWKSIEL